MPLEGQDVQVPARADAITCARLVLLHLLHASPGFSFDHHMEVITFLRGSQHPWRGRIFGAVNASGAPASTSRERLYRRGTAAASKKPMSLYPMLCQRKLLHDSVTCP
jgi:hypothetical protein